MKDFLKELFDYNYETNNSLVLAFTNNRDKISDKALNLFSHLLCAHHIWNNRIENLQPLYSVWQVHAIDSLKEINLLNYQQTLQILETADLDRIIDYQNSNGQAFSKKMRDILFHVINHSTYHRAQIATEFKLNGLTPLSTDYILYK